MKKKNIIPVLLAAALMFSGCESKSDVVAEKIQTSDSVGENEVQTTSTVSLTENETKSEDTSETELYIPTEKNSVESDTVTSAGTPAVTTATEETAMSIAPTVTTADTSGMDFSFDEEKMP